MNIQITSQPLPTGFCALTDAQWQTLLALLSVQVTDGAGYINVGQSPPDPDAQQYPWFRLLSDGSPDRVYYYWNGLWLSRHALSPGAVMLYGGAAGTIATFDGGEAAPATATVTSGPMWEQWTDMDAKFALAPGTLASGTVVSVGDEGGEETHTLIKGEMPVHQHYYTTAHDTIELLQYVAGQHEVQTGTSWKANPANQTDTAGNGQAHNTMPPYRAVYYIRRTARLFYRV